MPTELAYSIHGEGTPRILMIHGWLTSGEVWAGVADQLADFGSSLAPDLRGFGDTGGVPDDTLESHVIDLLALLDELGIERIAVAGHSMGGVIAQRLAIEAPERVSSLVLVNPVPASGFQLPPEAYAQFEAVGGNREAVEGFLTPQFVDPETAPPFVDIAMKATAQSARSTLAAWTGASFAERLGEVRAPTLVVCGTQDAYLTTEILDAAVVQPISDARLAGLDSGGHYVLVDDPGAVAALIRDHVS